MNQTLKKLTAALLTACMLFGMVPMPAFAAGQDSIVLGQPMPGGGRTSYILPKLTVTSEAADGINTILVSVDSGTFDPKVASTTLGANVQTLDTIGTGAGMTRTYIIENGTSVALAQDFLRGIEFTLEDADTPQNITITTDRNTTNLPAGMTLSTLMLNGKAHYYGYYEYGVSDETSWEAAYNMAKAHTLMGMKGYLVTITAAEEDKVLDDLNNKPAWSAGTREVVRNAGNTAGISSVDGDTFNRYATASPYEAPQRFYWACGPESLDDATAEYWTTGDRKITDNTDSDKPVFEDNHTNPRTNWGHAGKNGEPNGQYADGETCMIVHANLHKGWNDVGHANPKSQSAEGYFVEFGGYTVDPGNVDSTKTATAPDTITQGDIFPVPFENAMSNIVVETPPTTVIPGKVTSLKLTAGGVGYYLPSAIAVTDHSDPLNPAAIVPTYTRAANGDTAELTFTVPKAATGKIALTGGTFQAPKPVVTVANAGTTYTMTAAAATTAPGGLPATSTTVEYQVNDTAAWQTYTTPLAQDGSVAAKAYRFRQSSTVDGLDNLLSDAVIPAVGYQPTKLINGSFEQPIVTGAGRFIEWEKAGPEFGWRSSEEAKIELVPKEAWNAGYGVTDAAGDGEVFSEMNLEKPTVLYQIIATEPGEVIQWSVKHRARDLNLKEKMSVYFFPAASTDNLPADTIANTALLNANTLQGTYETSHAAWATYGDIYVVPEGQTLTCFAFRSDKTVGVAENTGNLIDDIRFDTVLSAITVSVDPVNPNSAKIAGYSAGTADTEINYGIFLDDGAGNATGSALNKTETSFIVGANKGEFEQEISLKEIPAGQYVIKAYTDEMQTKDKASEGTFLKKAPTVDVTVKGDDVTVTVVPKLDASATPAANRVYASDPTVVPKPAALVVSADGKVTLPADFLTNPEAGGPFLYVQGEESTGNEVTTRTNYVSTGAAHKSSKTGIAVSGTTIMTGITPVSETLKLAPAKSGKVQTKTGGAWVNAVMSPAYNQTSATMTASHGDGAYLVGFEVNGTLCKTTAELQAAQADKAATLDLNHAGDSGTLTLNTIGKQHVYAVYRNLLGEINAAKTTTERKTLLDDAMLSTVFAKGTETIVPMHAEYGKLSVANKAKVAALLGSMKPAAGYQFTEFVTAYNSAVGLFALMAHAGTLNENDYTTGTWAELVAAKTAANAILASTDTPRTIAEVTAAQETLQKAIAGLQFKSLTLLVKAPEAQLSGIAVAVDETRAPVTFAMRGTSVDSMASTSFFPAIGTDVTITVTKASYAGKTMTATVVGGAPLHFTDGSAGTMTATIPSIQKSTTIVFDFVGSTVNVVLPTVPGLQISTDGKTNESGKTLVKDAGQDIILTVTPEDGKILVPGVMVKVTIGGADKEYPLGADGTVTIPGADVTGDVRIDGGSLSGATETPGKDVIEVLLNDLKKKYADKLTDYTPTSMDALQKAIAATEAELKKTAPDVKKLEELYKAATAAEGKLVRQYVVTVPPALTPAASGTAPSGWNAKIYGADTTAEFIAPGVTKVTAKGAVTYYVETGKSLVLTGTTAANTVATGATYTQGTTTGKTAVVTDKTGTHTVTIADITDAVKDITVTTGAKTIVILPGDILPPEGGNTGSITPGVGAGTVVLDPGAGNKVTEVVIDGTTVPMPDDELLAAIREAIKDSVTDGEVTIHYPTPSDNVKITVDVDAPSAGKITGTVTTADGRELAVIVDKATGVTETVTVKGKTPPDAFETITLNPEDGKVTVQFPAADTGSHTVGGTVTLKTHGVAITPPESASIATVSAANKPQITAVAKDKFAESHDVVIVLTPAKDMTVDAKQPLTYVVTSPVSGTVTIHEIDPLAPDADGSFTVDPATGVITVSIPAKHAVGAITLPMDNLKNNILSADLLRLKELAKLAAELRAQKDDGTYTATDEQWSAIDAAVAGSPAKVAAEIIAGTDTTTAVKDAVKALEDAIKAVTAKPTDVSKLPGKNPTPGTGITKPAATITTPDAGNAGGDDGKLTFPGDNLVITDIVTEPGYVPDEVIITVKDPVTGKETEVKIPLDTTPGTGNTTGNNPYTATIKPDQKVPPENKTFEDIIKELKPGEITDIAVTGKKSGTVLPAIEAILALSNGKTGHKNGVGTTSSAVSALTITPESSADITDAKTIPVIPEGKSVSFKATLGVDDYTETAIKDATNWSYAFSGVKVNGKLLDAAGYTAKTTGGVVTIAFTAAQLTALGDVTSLEIVTLPTNPQYRSFVAEYAALGALYEAYAKPDASTQTKQAFEQSVANLLRQFDANAPLALRLTADNRAHLADCLAQLQAYADAIAARRNASQTSDAIDAMYEALNKSTTAAGDPMPVADPITEAVAKAVLAHEAEIARVQEAFDKLTPAEQNEVTAERQKKLQEAADALQKAKNFGKTPDETLSNLLKGLPTDILKNAADAKQGLKDTVSHADASQATKNIYGIDESKNTISAADRAALKKLGELDRQLEVIEKFLRENTGTKPTLAEQKTLSDLRTAIEKEYADYAQLFANEQLTDSDTTVGSPASSGTYPMDAIKDADWGKYPEELIDAKGEFDKLPQKVQDAVNNLTKPTTIDDLTKTEFPDVVRPVGLTAESILEELDKDAGAGTDYVLVADLDSKDAVAPSNKTGAEWAESIIKTYEKFQKLTPEEQAKVNNALSDGNKMEDLYNKAKELAANSPESQAAADKFIRDHLTVGGNVILVATDANKSSILGGEADWNKLSEGAKKAVNDKLAAIGGKSYPVLLADAKALGNSDGGSGGSGGGGGGGGSTGGAGTGTDVGDPAKNGVSSSLNTVEHMAYLVGDEAGRFNPDSDMTRAEVAQMFYNLLNRKTASGAALQFSDVAADAWYAAAVDTLTRRGILNGRSNDIFAPDEPISRAEFAAIAARFADKAAGTKTYHDVPAAHWAYESIRAASYYGWMNGYADGNFRPDALITRAEATKTVNAMLGRSGDKHAVDVSSTLRSFTDVSKTHWAYYEITEATNAHNHKKASGVETWIR